MRSGFDPMTRLAAETTRRTLFRQLAGVAASAIAAGLAAAAETGPEPPPAAISSANSYFLLDIEKANFLFFWEQADPESGLVKDRCNVRHPDKNTVASIAGTGFGLTAICIGQQNGWVSYRDANNRALTTLRFLARKMPTHRGFYHHWADLKTGQRVWDSEVSSVDTALLLCGIITCLEHFRSPEIVGLAYEIFNRVDWTWLSEDTTLLPHGWTPESGFLPYRWDLYSEHMMLYLLGMGSDTHPLPAETWNAWKRTLFDYEGMRYIGSFAPLFIHQYSQAWFDFRGRHDKYTDYFQNSVTATEVHRRFCLELSKQFPDYSDDLWGISASDSQHGYVVWGGPPEGGPIDGTVVPSAAGGSLPFLPDATLRVLNNMKNRYGAKAWCRYGFVNAFNPLKNWYDTDVVAIDTGITMLMAENLRTGFVWKTFMRNPEVRRGIERAGFVPNVPAGRVAGLRPTR
jgi:hypothetical protein